MRILEGDEVDLDQTVWRYMRTSRFLELLDQQQFYFASANEFEDQFEGAVALQPHDWPVDPRYPEPDCAFAPKFEPKIVYICTPYCPGYNGWTA